MIDIIYRSNKHISVLRCSCRTKLTLIKAISVF